MEKKREKKKEKNKRRRKRRKKEEKWGGGRERKNRKKLNMWAWGFLEFFPWNPNFQLSKMKLKNVEWRVECIGWISLDSSEGWGGGEFIILSMENYSGNLFPSESWNLSLKSLHIQRCSGILWQGTFLRNKIPKKSLKAHGKAPVFLPLDLGHNQEFGNRLEFGTRPRSVTCVSIPGIPAPFPSPFP